MSDNEVFGAPEESPEMPAMEPEEQGEEGSGPGFMERAVVAYTEPSRVFRYLAEHPQWKASFLFVLLFSMVSAQAVLPLSQKSALQMYTRNTDLSAEQLQQIQGRIENMTSPTGRVFSAVSVTLGMSIWLILVGAAFLFAGNFLMGGEASFRQILAVTTHAWIPYIVTKSVVTVPLMLAKGSLTVATSLAILLPANKLATPIGVLLGSVDVFTIWMLALLSIGLGVVYRWSTGKAAALVVSLYAILVLIAMGFTAMFSGFMPT